MDAFILPKITSSLSGGFHLLGEIPLDKCSLATTSWEEFLSGTFADFRDYDEIVPQDIEEAAKLNDPDDLYAENGRAFTKRLIRKNLKYYSISAP